MRVSILHPTGGALVRNALTRRGHQIVTDSPDVGYVRTCTYPPWRERSLNRLRALHRKRIPSLPTYRDSTLYDNKIAQTAALAPWLPVTHVVTSRDALPSVTFPLVSKSAQGAASKNVRLIRDHAEAIAEADAVFGGGLRIHHGVQRGYLIWQEFIPNNDHDIRVVLCGDSLFGLWRHNRKDVPFASGSGVRDPIRNLDDEHVRDAFALAIEIADRLETRWACFDFVSRNGRPLVLEISFSWVESAYAACPLFGRDLRPLGRTAAVWPDLAVDELERLARVPVLMAD